MQFSKRLDRFGDEIFAALNNRRMELEAQGMKIYNMSVGTPDFKTPEYIKKAVAEAAMDDNNWKYSLRDLPELLDGHGNDCLWKSGRNGASWHGAL